MLLSIIGVISTFVLYIKNYSMKCFKEKKILITGGAGGLGKIIARKMLESSGRVIIWDMDAVKVDQTVKEFSHLGDIFGFSVDVTNVDEVKQAADKVKREIGVVDVLINNAGIVVGKLFKDHSVADIQNVMNVNANGPMYVTREFLGDMLNQDSGHICNIASSAGIIANPKMSVYAASKWAVVGWSESLRVEIAQMKKSVKVTTILPYYINTGMFDGVESLIPILDPEKVGGIVVRAIKKDVKIRSISRSLYFFARLGQALLPVSVFDYVAGEVLGIYKTMDNFVGHKV